MAQTETVNYATPRDPTAVKPPMSRDLAAGGLSGIIAGLVLAAVLMLVFALFLGRTLIFPLQVIGSTAYGDGALQSATAPVILVGLVLHLAVSIFWGLVFGAVVHALQIREGSRLLMLGIVIGLLAQVLDANFIVPRVFDAAHGHNIWGEQVPQMWSWIGHIAYGATLAVFPWAFRKLGPVEPGMERAKTRG